MRWPELKSAAKSWSPEEEAKLRELYPVVSVRDLASVFSRTPEAVKSRAHRLRIVKAKGRKDWNAADRWMLRTFYPHVRTAIVAQRLNTTIAATYRQAKILGLHKSQAYLDSPDACRLRRGDNVGAGTRFTKGHVSANKGLRRPGYAPGRMRETQFKKGLQPHNTMPLWSFRFVDGYLMLKTGAPTARSRTGAWRGFGGRTAITRTAHSRILSWSPQRSTAGERRFTISPPRSSR